MREVFGKPRVLDIAVPLDRNHMPFLVIHVGVRSTFLRFVGENAYEPWMRAALEFVLLAIFLSMAVAALLSAVALRPLQAIGEQLERLTLTRGNDPADPLVEQPLLLESQTGRRVGPVNRVNLTIDRLGRQMRTREEGYTALQTNLDQMLDTLRDGVLLFAPDRRAVMVSDAVVQFLDRRAAGPYVPAVDDMVGMPLEQIFLPETTLGAAVAAAFERGAHSSAETVTLEDGRTVQISLDRIDEGRSNSQGERSNQSMGTLLTLRDTGSAIELEQELEVARRLAAIGRLTTNVGHEVKNPINAMVVHLELLRGKLASDAFDRGSAQRHVEILADEMQRLDRVVETLADFSRPMDLDLRELDLRRVIDQTLDLAGAELKENSVVIESESPPNEVPVRIDAELMRQALLNLLLNAMQAMPSGGVVRISVRRDQRLAFVEIADTGDGIPASVLPRIFDLYFTTKPKGSGIGLAMTYRILQLHGGALDVRSNADPSSPEHGTTFTLRIPISLNHPNEGRRQAARLAIGGDIDEPIPSDDEIPASIASTIEKGERLTKAAPSCAYSPSRNRPRRRCRHKIVCVSFSAWRAGASCAWKSRRIADPPPMQSPTCLCRTFLPYFAARAHPMSPDEGLLRTPKEETPTQGAESAPASELAIGTLSSGGDLAPQIQQQAQDMISSILKRISSAFPSKTADAEKPTDRGRSAHFLDRAAPGAQDRRHRGRKEPRHQGPPAHGRPRKEIAPMRAVLQECAGVHNLVIQHGLPPSNLNNSYLVLKPASRGIAYTSCPIRRGMDRCARPCLRSRVARCRFVLSPGPACRAISSSPRFFFRWNSRSNSSIVVDLARARLNRHRRIAPEPCRMAIHIHQADSPALTVAACGR